MKRMILFFMVLLMVLAGCASRELNKRKIFPMEPIKTIGLVYNLPPPDTEINELVRAFPIFLPEVEKISRYENKGAQRCLVVIQADGASENKVNRIVSFMHKNYPDFIKGGLFKDKTYNPKYDDKFEKLALSQAETEIISMVLVYHHKCDWPEEVASWNKNNKRKFSLVLIKPKS